MPIKVVNTWPPNHMIHGLIEHEKDRCMTQLPSGKNTKSYWKWAIYSGFTHWKWWFSIVMLVYQRVIWINRWPLQSWTKYWWHLLQCAPKNTTWLSDFVDCVTHSAQKQVYGIFAALVDHYCPHRTFCLPGTHRGCLNIMWSHDNETLHSLYNNHTQYPRVICYIAIENGHRNSGFTHWKWWCSIVFCMFTRGYHSSGSLIWKLGPSANDSPHIHHLQTGMSRRHDVKAL